MKIRQFSYKKCRIDIVPMIDVIFFLLVFFMVTSKQSYFSKLVQIQLPKTTFQNTTPEKVVQVAIDVNGYVYLNDKKIDFDSLRESLSHAMLGNPQQSLVIVADKNVLYDKVIFVMEEAKKTGVRKFALATR